MANLSNLNWNEILHNMQADKTPYADPFGVVDTAVKPCVIPDAPRLPAVFTEPAICPKDNFQPYLDSLPADEREEAERILPGRTIWGTPIIKVSELQEVLHFVLCQKKGLNPLAELAKQAQPAKAEAVVKQPGRRGRQRDPVLIEEARANWKAAIRAKQEALLRLNDEIERTHAIYKTLQAGAEPL